MKEKLTQASALLTQAKLNDLTVGHLMAVANAIGQCLMELERQEQVAKQQEEANKSES